MTSVRLDCVAEVRKPKCYSRVNVQIRWKGSKLLEELTPRLRLGHVRVKLSMRKWVASAPQDSGNYDLYTSATGSSNATAAISLSLEAALLRSHEVRA